MSAPTSYRVLAPFRGKTLQIGTVANSGAGWRFFPIYLANVSRKAWPTADAAVKHRVKTYTLEAA